MLQSFHVIIKSLCCFQSNTEILLKPMYVRIVLYNEMPGNTNNLKIPRMSSCCFRNTYSPFSTVCTTFALLPFPLGEGKTGGRKAPKIGALRVQTNKSAAAVKLRLIFLS